MVGSSTAANLAAAIPITVIIAAWVWSSHRRSKQKLAPDRQRPMFRDTPTPTKTALRPAPMPEPRPSSPSKAASTAPSVPAPQPTDLLAGDYFMMCILRGTIPPPGQAFINRFCNGFPQDWLDEWGAAGIGVSSPAKVNTSLVALEGLLNQLVRDGAPLPAWQAAEEAVTINLTAFVVLHAAALAVDKPELRACAEFRNGDGFPGWVPDDPVVDALALMIRDLASSADAALCLDRSAAMFAGRPDRCLRAAVEVIGAVRLTLAQMSVGDIAAQSDPSPTRAAALSKAIDKLQLANMAIALTTWA